MMLPKYAKDALTPEEEASLHAAKNYAVMSRSEALIKAK